MFGNLEASVEAIKKIEEVTLTSKSVDKKFIQKELLDLAVAKAIPLLVAEQGHNLSAFEKAQQEKFDLYFERYKEGELAKRFGRGYGATLSAEEKKKFLQGIEIEKASHFQIYSQYLALLESHRFLSLDSDPKSGVHKGKVELIFDRLKVERKFKRILSTENKPFGQIRLLSEINLIDLKWQDLSLDQEETFARPLKVSWENFINENLPQKVEEAIICEDDCLNYYLTWEELSQEQLQKEALTPYSKDLWLKVSLNLRKLTEKSGGDAFSWEGRVVLIEVKSKRVIASFQLFPEEKEWMGLDPKALNSALATRLYKSPLTAFKQLEQKLSTLGGSSRSNKLVIKGHRHLGEVQELIQLLQTRGSSLGLKIQLSGIKGSEAELLCFYQGEEKSFTDLLSQLKELKSSQTSAIIFETSGGHHRLTLVKP